MQLTQQLDYFSAMLQDSQHGAQDSQQQQQGSAQQANVPSAFQILQNLEPYDAEWIPAAAAADKSLLAALQDDPLSNDASPLQR
jgi:hypothetical protein